MEESQAKRFIRHTSIYAVGDVARQLTGFIMLPIYTRYLTPADYGVIGLLMFSLSLVEIVFGARFIQAIPKFYYAEKNENARTTMISTAWLITVSASLCVSLLLMANSNSISLLLFDTDALVLVVTLYSINLVTIGMENYGLVYIRVREKPVLFVGMGLAKMFVQLGANILLVVIYEMGVMGVVLSSVLSSALFAVILSLYLLIRTGIRFNRKKAVELIIFCWPLWVAGFAALYIGSSNRLFLKEFISLEAVGLFALASKLSTILILIVWRPISQYWQVERFKYYIPDKPAPEIYRRMHKVISILLIIAALAITLFSKPVIIIMADSEISDLEQRIDELIALTEGLSTENNLMRERQEILVEERARLIEKAELEVKKAVDGFDAQD